MLLGHAYMFTIDNFQNHAGNKPMKNTLNKLGVCVALCFIFLGGCSPKTELEQAVENATAGNVNAQYNLGMMYRYGEGVPQDYAEAMKWLRLAADQGVAEAQHRIGQMHHNGEGVPQDYAEAVKWYRLAADQGFAVPRLNLAVMYYNGLGVPQDYVEAYAWSSVAAAGGIDVDYRDSIVGELTPEQLAEGQKRATELLEKISSGK